MDYYQTSPLLIVKKETKNWSKSIETVKVAKSYITASFALIERERDNYSRAINNKRTTKLKFLEKKSNNSICKPLVTEFDISKQKRVKDVLLDPNIVALLPPIPIKEKSTSFSKKNNFKKINLTNDKLVKINQIKFGQFGRYEKFIQRHNVGNIFYNHVQLEK